MPERKLRQPLDEMADELLATPCLELITCADTNQSRHEIVPANANREKWCWMGGI